MDQGDRRNITLIGFSTTGKSTVGRRVANLLGWRFVDTDDRVVELYRKPIPSIFVEEGEERFRELERLALQEALAGQESVIATGGGAILGEENRELMRRQSIIICLEARVETIFQRLAVDSEGDSPVVRPLLSGEDPQARIASLKERRQSLYAIADWTVNTDVLSQDEVAAEVVHGWRLASRGLPSHSEDVGEASAFKGRTACVVRASSGSYPIYIGWGALEDMGRRMVEAGFSASVHLISDSGVFPQWGSLAEDALRSEGFEVASYCVQAGETSKSLEVVAKVYDWLIERKAERGQAIVALGGGVVGDLAGFVAATFLRGVPFVQVPTTLLAMVDSSIGGKTGVNHPAGKNLVGAFYQPRLVLTDPRTLATLPRRELISGWAEVVKHALILDAGLFDRMENRVDDLLGLDPDLTSEVIARSAAIKAEVVSQDEKETGLRTILNYGHTIGHAVEAATTYGSYFHGEAVSIGMMGAALISHQLGLIPLEIVERQRRLLQKLGLPIAYRNAKKEQLVEAVTLDKKVSDKSVRWVLLKGLGEAIVRSDVPASLVDSVLDELRDGNH